ncbi:MAG: DUF5060 domain-containing protein [Granulosicoccus sp.]
MRASVVLFALLIASFSNAATVQGERAKWHPITLDFRGPLHNETDQNTNPFLDYRLTVDFKGPDGQLTRVPGFFAGDGQGNGRGDVWRVRFSADQIGRWTYQANLRRGSELAVSLDLQAGTAVSLDGASGSFDVSAVRDDAPSFLRQGRLEYVGEHYLKFRDGPYWIKGGTDSPENLLGFAGIDGTSDHGGIDGNFLHDFAAHRGDWRESDPLFNHASTGADSRGLIGALNYLGSQGVNSIYFLPMNLGGDGQETYPFVGAEKTRFNKTHYDISKLFQWNIVLNHAQKQGVALNIVLSETEIENERWLDNGALGVERKLFFRELVARFGYLLAVKWNLGEENDYPYVELLKHADYLQAIDWSKKPIAVHTHINQFFRYGELIGDKQFSASSIQYDQQFAGEFVEQWRRNSANAGRPWVIDMDENTNGLGPDNADERRKQIMYDVFFSGGNIEWYFGYNPLPAGGDVNAGDFRIREPMWQQMRYAREMMQNELPFWRMEPADSLISGEDNAYGGAEVFALPGEVYAIYLPRTNGAERLDMRAASGGFRQRWFNPRTAEMINGRQDIVGSSVLNLGSPPSAQGNDWVVIISKIDSQSVSPVAEQPALQESGNQAPRFQSVPSPDVSIGDTFAIALVATDDDGTFPSVTVGSLPAGMRINGPGNGQLELSWVVPANADANSTVELIAIDALDASLRTTQVMSIRVNSDRPITNNAPPISGSNEASAPVFISTTSQSIRLGERLALRIQADDADGIPPALLVLNAPQNSSFEDNGDGTRTFYWSPDASQLGSTTLTFLAQDHALPTLTASMNVDIQVTP